MIALPRRARPSAPEQTAERALERRIAEREARRLEPRGHDARAGEQELVGHLAQEEAREEGGQGQERGAAEDTAERARQLAGPYGLGGGRVDRPRAPRRRDGGEARPAERPHR